MRDPAGIARAIEQAETVCICSHVSPDGDTIGSALAMRLVLQGMGKRVSVFCQDKVPDNLMFLPGVECIRKPETNRDRYDLFLPVDVSDAARLGTCAELMQCCTHSALIDHHGTNPGFTEVNSIDGKASATCTMIREQMKYLKTPLTKDIAVCLYTGISTDTGNFSFDCTDPEAFQVMGDLLETGLPLAQLNMILFREKSVAQLRLLGRAIEKMTFAGDGKIAVMKLTMQDFQDCGALSEHSDTLVNYGLETVGTKMALLARENEDGKIKISLRARDPLTVDGVAAELGGGGHPRAAGISMEGDLDACTAKVVEKMAERLKQSE